MYIDDDMQLKQINVERVHDQIWALFPRMIIYSPGIQGTINCKLDTVNVYEKIFCTY